MTTSRGPRTGSKAFIALQKLHGLGGVGQLGTWMNSMLWSDSISEFLRQAVNALTARNLVSLDGTDYKMTAAAMLFLDVDPEAAAIIPATIVGPRYQVERQALDVARHCRRPLMREGALAFRDIPSLLGNERVAHGEMAGDRATGGRQR